MRHIKRCLNPELAKICQHVIDLDGLNLKVQAYLPEALRPHCLVGSFEKGCLVLNTKQSVWASQIRYFLPELRDKLRSEAALYNLRTIKLQVGAEESTLSISSKKSLQPLSQNGRDVILEAADRCAHAGLKQALQKLADNSKP